MPSQSHGKTSLDDNALHSCADGHDGSRALSSALPLKTSHRRRGLLHDEKVVSQNHQYGLVAGVADAVLFSVLTPAVDPAVTLDELPDL